MSCWAAETHLQGTGAFIASAWATHAAACHANGLRLLQPSRSLFLAGKTTKYFCTVSGSMQQNRHCTGVVCLQCPGHCQVPGSMFACTRGRHPLGHAIGWLLVLARAADRQGRTPQFPVPTSFSPRMTRSPFCSAKASTQMRNPLLVIETGFL